MQCVNLFFLQPKPAKSEGLSGYDGFVIKHVLDSGETHPIEVARCSFPILETALLETAPLDINPKILSKEARKNIRNTIVACPQAPPKKPKTKSVA